MDVSGQYFLVNKHIPIGKKKKRRFFFTAEEIEKQIELAEKYAGENREDYLIVQVVREVSDSSKKVKEA